MDPRTNALLMVILDMDPEVADEAEFDQWFSDEHVAERLDCDGFLAAHRFELAPETSSGPGGPMPRHLTLYELESLDALDTAEYQSLRNPGSELTERMRPAMRNVTRAAFSRRA